MSCPACFRGFVHDGTPTGVDVSLESASGAAIAAYYAAPPAGTAAAPTILYLSDIFGHTFVNARLLADTYAAAGFHVFVPDILGGDAVPAASLNVLDDPPSTSLGTWLWNGLRLVAAIPGLVPWLARHGTAATLPRVKAAARAVRARGVALGSSGKLGAVGFCFGGRYACLLAHDAAAVDAFVAVHPSSLAVPGDVAPIAARGLFALAETDEAFSPAQARAAAALLAAREAPGAAGTPAARWRFSEYAKMTHGFAVRGGPHTDAERARCAADVTAYLAEVLKG